MSVGRAADRRRTTRQPLPDGTKQLLREGREGDPFGAQMSLVLSLRQHGWSKSDIWNALLDPRHRAGGWTRGTIAKYGVKAGRAELRRLIAKADRWISERPPIGDRADAIDALAGILAAADAQPWPGRSGSTDRTVLEGYVRLAIRAGGPRFRASLRQVAEATNMHRTLVEQANKRLRNGGWLTRAERGAGQTGTTWLVHVGARAIGTVPPRQRRMTTVPLSLVNLAKHDAFTAHGLGATAARLFALLVSADEPISVADLALSTGLHASTVRRALSDRLESAGLADRVEGLWSPTERDPERLAAKLDRLAQFMGTSGTGEERKARHEEERASYADAVAAKSRRRLRVIQGGRKKPRSKLQHQTRPRTNRAQGGEG